MKFSRVDMTTPQTKEYRVHGSALPTTENPAPQVFVATIYTKNHVFAKTKFFKILEKKHKIKASRGMIINCEEVVESLAGDLQNFGVTFVYRSKRGIHNSYKECRALNRCGAVDYVLREVSGRHGLKRADVNIISVQALALDELKRSKTMEFASEDVEFPVFRRMVNTKRPIVAAEYNLSD